MQEWQKLQLGSEYVARKHYAKSLHRLVAVLQVMQRLSVVFDSTAQTLRMFAYPYSAVPYLQQ